MQNIKVEDFIKYAKEQFGCDIVLNSSSEPDSFEKIFGISFLEQDIDIEIQNGFYENTFMDVQFFDNSVMDFSYVCDMDLAA